MNRQRRAPKKIKPIADLKVIHLHAAGLDTGAVCSLPWDCTVFASKDVRFTLRPLWGNDMCSGHFPAQP